MQKIGSVILLSLILAGCGGGGGGGATGGASLLSEWLGTNQNAIPYNGTDGNGPVTTPSGKTYDFTHGTPDPDGVEYAKFYNQGQSNYTVSQSASVFGATASSASCGTKIAGLSGCGITLLPPNADVISAWNQGWTGAGVNIFVIDAIGDTKSINGTTYNNPHAAIVASLAGRYAPGSMIYGASYNTASTVLNLDGSHADLSAPIKIGVINASFGADLSKILNRQNTSSNPWQIYELEMIRSSYLSSANSKTQSIFLSPTANLSTLDAVISKSAGNDHIDAQYDLYNYSLANNSNTQSRLLIVGALDRTGSTTSKATIASYSNFAGTDFSIQNRFLVASGQLPFDPTTISYDGITPANFWDTTDIQGTSFAAPRVAGYAAILRQKFPNLTAASTADILLQTARYDTLSCHPNCNKAIYGQGEASLSHALAPVGALR